MEFQEMGVSVQLLDIVYGYDEKMGSGVPNCRILFFRGILSPAQVPG